MRRERILLLAGVWIAILPYLGFPFFWKNVLLSVSGLALVAVAYVMYRENKKDTEDTFDNFRDSHGGTEGAAINQN